jgi:hypothetical protein
MSNPVIDAFFLGRALAEVVGERFEDAYTNAMSELGKFDAEQREHLRAFIEEVQLRAQQSASNGYTANSGNAPGSETTEDLQEMLDRLRAEIASLRAELKKYRN